MVLLLANLPHVELAPVLLVGELLGHQLLVRLAAQREQADDVRAPSAGLVEVAVRDTQHHDRDVEVPAPNAQVRQLLPVRVVHRDVVHQYQHVALSPFGHQVKLLLFEPLHQLRVPLVELKRPEAVLVQEGMQVGVAVRAPHEAKNQIKLSSLQQPAA